MRTRLGISGPPEYYVVANVRSALSVAIFTNRAQAEMYLQMVNEKIKPDTLDDVEIVTKFIHQSPGEEVH